MRMKYHDLFIHLDRDEDGLTLSLDAPETYGLDAAEQRLEFDHQRLPDRLQQIDDSLGCIFDPQRTSEEDRETWRRRLRGQVYELGVDLHRALHRGEVGEFLARQLGYIEADRNQGLRLRIVTNPKDGGLHEMAAAPWEMLCDEHQEQEGFLGKDRRFPISRYFSGAAPITPLPVDGPLKVLLVPSLPVGPKAPKPVVTGPEMRVIREALKTVEGVQVDQSPAILEELRDRISDEGFHVLHFIGHGGFSDQRGENWVTFEKEDGTAARWPGDLLASGLKSLPSLRLVVLSNCYGAAMARRADQNAFLTAAPSFLLRAQIPALVAMQFPISDEAATTFSRRFYGRLAKGDGVDVAASTARQAIDSLVENPTTRVQWPLPAVFMRVRDGRLLIPSKHGATSGGARSDTSGPKASEVRKETIKIGIRSFNDRFATDLEDHVDLFLKLDDLFEDRSKGRFIRRREDWNGEVMSRLSDFISGFAGERRRLEINFAAHWSIALATGWFLEAKSGLDLSFVQRGQSGTSTLVKEDGDVPAGDLWSFEERTIGSGTDLAVTISISRQTPDDVEEYLGQEHAPSVGRLLHASVPEVGPEAVKSGLHALLLAQELDRVISRRTVPERRGTIHLFGAVPNTFTFFLGQLSPGWGDTQLYEFAFRQPESFGKYTPSILLPPRG